MDDVIGGDQQADLLVGGHHDRMVHVEQVLLGFWRISVDCIAAGGGEVAEEAHPFVEVIVLPLPLVAGDLNVEIRIAGVLQREKGAGGGDGHTDQDHEGYDGPQDLDNGALMELGGLSASGLAVVEDGVGHSPEHGDADSDADPDHQHVQVPDVTANGGDALGHVQSPIRGRAGAGKQRRRSKKAVDIVD